MNKKIFKILYLTSLLALSSCSSINKNDHIHNDSCSDIHEHEDNCNENHDHHEDNKINVLNTLSTSKDKIYDIPDVVTFVSTNSESNYGEITIKANYSPSGCLKDTIWEVSDSSKIKLEVDETDSSICKLICIEKFEGELVIKATSKYFKDIFYEINVTYKDSFEIVSKSEGISLTGSQYRNCSGSSYTFTYSNLIDITSLYEVSDKNVEISYSVSHSELTINNSSIRMNSAISGTYYLYITPRGYEDKKLTIPISASYTSSSGSHSYIVLVDSGKSPTTCINSSGAGRYATYKCEYCSATTGGGTYYLSHQYTYKRIISSATCTTSGSYKWECRWCTLQSGGGSISALGHNYRKSSYKVCPDCSSKNISQETSSTWMCMDCKSRGPHNSSYWAYEYTCTRCSDSYISK